MNPKKPVMVVLVTIATAVFATFLGTLVRAQPADPNGGIPGGRGGRRGGSALALSRIIKFKPIDSDQDAYPGYLLVRSLRPGASVERVLVPQWDRMKMTVPGHDIDVDDYESFLIKGIVCEVQSKDIDSSQSPSHISKEATQINMSVVEIEGRIKRITDDMVRLRAKPLDDKPWPHLAAAQDKGSRATSQTSRNDPARFLIVRFQILEDLTELVDEDDWAVDPSDFREGEPVWATVIIGRPRGILLRLKPAPQSDPDL